MGRAHEGACTCPICMPDKPLRMADPHPERGEGGAVVEAAGVLLDVLEGMRPSGADVPAELDYAMADLRTALTDIDRLLEVAEAARDLVEAADWEGQPLTKVRTRSRPFNDLRTAIHKLEGKDDG